MCAPSLMVIIYISHISIELFSFDGLVALPFCTTSIDVALPTGIQESFWVNFPMTNSIRVVRSTLWAPRNYLYSPCTLSWGYTTALASSLPPSDVRLIFSNPPGSCFALTPFRCPPPCSNRSSPGCASLCFRVHCHVDDVFATVQPEIPMICLGESLSWRSSPSAWYRTVWCWPFRHRLRWC